MGESLRAEAMWLTLQDSAFPAGRMVHSNGIESWLRAHPDVPPAMVVDLVIDLVVESVATLDAVILAHAWAAEGYPELFDLDRLLLSYKTSEQGRCASVDPGRRFAETVQRVGVMPAENKYLNAVIAEEVPGNLAVVEGIVSRAIGIDQPLAVLGALRSSMASALSACVRLGRLGAMAANRALVGAAPHATSKVNAVLAVRLEDLRSNAIEIDTWAIRHDRYTPRLFAS
ncbi:hypothetical protein A5788_15180 [Gordonia sp. 852002-50816_SCH5313054-c]|uniref:urease accessory protein UreF n=1 Tax=unclassified Gordonia (in: high G+C Gram-positive bacteria) TaxID=2657482 RepID=UPI0007E9EFB1|nr:MULTISPECIES: urease accessory UreF family protein [unclassified Gordonia (in: high G+C Gram-positive bacteria)]OBC08003.1 hypothetical protein A5786_08550 [Gordonia sp. 852002-50816_SCH5313054-a]OBC15764.1 hypothetical protein A5788_15180 [Gordonia sp. 852002-50816_SCH5313054-c]